MKILKRMFHRPFRDIVINLIAASGLTNRNLRYLLYKIYGIDVKTKAINPGTFFGGNNIKIGENSSINYNCFFDNTAPIIIGKYCTLSFNITLSTASHEIGTPECRAGKTIGAPIIIEDGCWIGANVIILQGVTVGKGCVIGAGAVVNKDCEPNGIYAGVPARRIKNLH